MLGFEVLRKLADGSAAEVFLAREETSQDRVIVEVIRPELTTDSEIYGRFLDLAKSSQALSHPYLLSRTSAGCGKDGRLFVVTEPVAGEHLGSWLVANGPMSAAETVRLMLMVCDALAYLHEHGRVHGHLRPSNVFLSGTAAAPLPKLLDTGLSLFRSSRSVVRPGSLVLVEAEYLSPERIRGQRADVLSDVYGLGVLMFEMLTGRPPFTSPDPAETRRRHLEDEPPALPERAERLAPVVQRCLAKAPSRRYPDVASLRQALSWLSSEGLPRTPWPPMQRPEPTPTRASVLPGPVEQADSLVVEEAVGEVLGNYELLGLLGQGGMGRVYLARHTKLDRKVAVKVLRPELATDPEQLQRFFQEARAVNRISHDHIVEIYDFVEEPPHAGGRVYFVMEALQGESLKARAQRAPLTIAESLKLVREVCAALEAAHAVDVVHRDVKPDNIFLVEKNGRKDFVKVLDFGVAKLRAQVESGNMQATRTGMVVGTPAYMAPEQALGHKVDHRTDIYSLGTVLYGLLSGKLPFDTSSLGPLMARIITQPPGALPECTPSGEPIPPALKAVVERCLAKQPDARYPSMAELSEALAQFEGAASPSFDTPRPAGPPPLPRAETESTAVLPSTPPALPGATAPRWRWKTTATAALITLFALGGAWMGWMRPRLLSAQAAPAPTPTTQHSGPPMRAMTAPPRKIVLPPSSVPVPQPLPLPPPLAAPVVVTPEPNSVEISAEAPPTIAPAPEKSAVQEAAPKRRRAAPKATKRRRGR